MKVQYCLFIFLLFAKPGIAQVERNDLAASKFLNSLSKEQKQKTIYGLEDSERYNWHFFPKTDRKGISLNELDTKQKESVYALLKTCLSSNGFEKTMQVVQLETVLQVLENRNDKEYRDPGKYFIIIFGEPHEKNSWGWRFEGHHISFSFSAMNNKLVGGTPGFLGANPATVPSGPHKGKQALKEETEAGFTLLSSLSADQLNAALSKSAAPNEIITFVSRRASINTEEGIKYSELTANQQKLLMNLIKIYIARYTKLFADQMVKEITDAGLEKLRFVWAGATKPEGKAYYYRIQGPTIIIEFDNSQGNANHIHSVLRDLKNDFGGDELMEHYKRSHK